MKPYSYKGAPSLPSHPERQPTTRPLILNPSLIIRSIGLSCMVTSLPLITFWTFYTTFLGIILFLFGFSLAFVEKK